jgi:hypothetical protein
MTLGGRFREEMLRQIKVGEEKIDDRTKLRIKSAS